MAINKAVNKSATSHGALRNCIQYVLKEKKIKDGLVYMTGPSPLVITWDTVYQSFMEEKKLWNKDSGRMYNHNIISFHKDEAITSEQALEFGKEFAEKWYPKYQTLISVHQDKDHVHIHLVTNSVSYKDGLKIHENKSDLQRMKNLTNQMCKERGLSVAEKGRHFDGSVIEEGTTIAWNKDKYRLLANDTKKSYVVDCAIAVLETKAFSCSKEEFEKGMEDRGWHVSWSDNKKHIVFNNDSGDKVRDSNISKTFSIDISKEVLLHEFERQNELRLEREKSERHKAAERERYKQQQLDKYYAEVESAINGVGDSSGKAIGSTETCDGGERQPSGTGQTKRSGNETEALIKDIRSEIADNRFKNRAVRDTEYQSETFEKQSIANERERRAKEQARIDAEERARGSWHRDCDFEEPCL